MRNWPRHCSDWALGLILGLSGSAAQSADVAAQASIDASVDTLLTVLEQPCHVRAWMPDLIEVKILDYPGPGQTRVYMATAAPWPFQPRDAITRFTRQQGNPVIITLQGEPDALPLRAGFIRIPASSGQWQLLSEGNQTLVTYRLRVDPGGRIPQWLAERASQRRAHAAMEALEIYAESPAAHRCLPAESDRAGGHGDVP